MTDIPVIDAARALEIRPGTLRRWIRQGCPARRGHRGRGCATLVDVGEVQRWRQASDREAVILELAGSLPEVLSEAASEAWKQAQGVDKRTLAGVMAATWYLSANAVNDYLQTRCPAVPDLDRIPESIERLQKIARK